MMRCFAAARHRRDASRREAFQAAAGLQRFTRHDDQVRRQRADGLGRQRLVALLPVQHIGQPGQVHDLGRRGAMPRALRRAVAVDQQQRPRAGGRQRLGLVELARDLLHHPFAFRRHVQRAGDGADARLERVDRRRVRHAHDLHADFAQALERLGWAGLLGRQHQVGLERQHALHRHRAVIADARQPGRGFRVQAGLVVAHQPVALPQAVHDLRHATAQGHHARRRRRLRASHQHPSRRHRQPFLHCFILTRPTARGTDPTSIRASPAVPACPACARQRTARSGRRWKNTAPATSPSHRWWAC